MNIKQIIEAWTIAINPNERELLLAKERVKICDVCESKTMIIVPVCSECGCPIGKKIFTNALNPCPLKKWEEIDVKYFPKDKIKKTLL